jgi:hypothetical protein
MKIKTTPRALKFRVASVALAGLLLAAPAAYSAELAKYEFTSSTRATTDTDLNSTATTLDNGAGISATDSTYHTTVGNPAPSLRTKSSTTTTTESLAVTGDDYYEFTLTPVTGFEVDLTTLTFDYNKTGSNAHTANFFVRSSIDSFASTIGSIATVSGTTTTTFSNASLSLSAAQYQNLTSAVTFRIYMFDNSGGAAETDLLDNVILNGTVAVVPEPSTWAMMVLGAGLLGAAQRFRRGRS